MFRPLLVLAIGCFSVYSIVSAHEGPDPLVHWVFKTENVRDGRVVARLGPQLTLSASNRLVTTESSEALLLQGEDSGIVLTMDHREAMDLLPRQDITVAAWVSVEDPADWGGVVGVLQDNGDEEAGWLVGYKKDRFVFGLASQGVDDGNGKLTYLTSDTPYVPGQLYHVVATYNGIVMRLYVNGELEGESDVQSGPILYPKQPSPIVIGRFQDDNEQFAMEGRIAELKVYDTVAKPEWVAHDFGHARALASLPSFPSTADFQFVVKPYLQNVGKKAITVMWQTSHPSSSVVHYGETADCDLRETGEDGTIHEVRLKDLKPDTQYFYRVETGKLEATVTDASGKESESFAMTSDPLTFQTAPDSDRPFAFAVISDTQANPSVAKQLSEMAWSERPSIVLHVGDLVDRGGNDDDWYEEFFPGMESLIGRVCLFPVLGNHEDDARNFYDYMSLPSPEYYYTFSYANAQYFMIDSNRNVDPASEQYKWLEEQLAGSKAQWKFVCHHHPPYSSDENDFGNLWETNESTRGDLRMRDLTTLYDKYAVDIVWNGHIHSYERTWPLVKGDATDDGGTVYMITGGGGGSLETPGPYRSGFQNVVERGHHYVMVHINGRQLELRAYDIDGKVFDSLQMRKIAE